MYPPLNLHSLLLIDPYYLQKLLDKKPKTIIKVTVTNQTEQQAFKVLTLSFSLNKALLPIYTERGPTQKLIFAITMNEQECIRVGCVPSAAVTV